MSEFNDTNNMHLKFELPNSSNRDLNTLSRADFKFRFGFLFEELSEFKDAHEKNNIVKMIDALIDLVIVAHGTASFMGVSPELWEKCWKAVTDANFAKVRGITKRGAVFDLVKPNGWIAPDIKIASYVSEIMMVDTENDKDVLIE